MKTASRVVPLLLAGTLLAGGLIARAEDPKPKYDLHQIMKAVFKGEDSIAKRISKGKATPEEIAKLVEYVTALPLNESPQGDQALWKHKAGALLEAAIAVRDGKPDAIAKYNQAVNCQACHRVFRPE